MRRLQLASSLVILFVASSGCDATSPLAPTPPPVSGPTSSSPAPPAGGGGISIAGYVQDRAWRPLIAARVEVLDGPSAGMTAGVDGSGQFRLAGMFDETTRFRASAAGHADVISNLPPRCPQCNPNWWIFFSLATVAPAVDLAGDYLFTVRAAPECTTLPEAFRSRTYAATIRPFENGAGQFTVALRGGTFLPNYDIFMIGVAGDFLAIPLGDYHGSPGIAEEVGEWTYLGFEGPVEGSLTSLASGTVTAKFDGTISYCSWSGPPGPRYACERASPLSSTFCRSGRHEVVLQRR